LVSGGSSVPFKIRGAVVTGMLGLACAVSVVAGKPLPLLVLQLRARRDAEAGRLAARAGDDPFRRHAITVLTALIGVTLLAAAAVRVILAVALSTSTFLSVSSVTQWAIIAAGGLPTVWYAHRQRSRLRSRHGDEARETDGRAPPVPGARGNPS
jgi:small-conductance mechanosensitive channel